MTFPNPSGTRTEPDEETILAVMRLAQRAPSVHNTQPWHWVLADGELHLHTDPDRMLPAADPHSRQQVISCGAMLHHVRTALAARGWHTDITRLPDPARPDHLAVLRFRPWPDPPAGIATRAAAIERRRTDRLPLLEPRGWDELLPALRKLVAPHDLVFEVLEDDAREQLAKVSARATTARDDDAMYQMELDWWTGHSGAAEGVPETSRVSAAEAARVEVGREFPTVAHSMRRPALTDRAELVALGSYGDATPQWLHTGEALSAVLLESTAAGLATCPITHVTELPAGRGAVADLLPDRATPQVVIRIGTAPAGEPDLPATPRRPLADILTVHHS
ncbi:Acg family FMN-binding oxidoreductase [Nocardia wallacei]|uniref:Acg family FMN-binding oxidoreductase n=1 Tax=Nocardia wallacei TaxID=480035 RepID=UPI002453BE6B|nr:nitroreductase family protein [Nocardia wallacei]